MKIPIQNVYYMLCFAWNCVPEELSLGVASIPASSDVVDLCAHLLTTGTELLMRRGLDQGYLLREEQTTRLRGRINVTQTVRCRLYSTPRAVCEFDELSPNVLHNQIIRASIGSLLHSESVSAPLKEKLRSAYGKLSGIDRIELSSGVFGRVQLHGNNRYYGFLLFVCKLLYSLRLPEHSGVGAGKFKDLLSDEKVMEKVFEEFLRNFYRLKQREFHSVGSNQLKWNATAPNSHDLALLPVMKTDITMRSSNRIIILDAKYYKNVLQEHHGTLKAHSGNIYQLTAYLRTEGGLQQSICPEGILIYPVSDYHVDASFVIDGYPVRLYTLNLNQDWRGIERDLLQLVSSQAA